MASPRCVKGFCRSISSSSFFIFKGVFLRLYSIVRKHVSLRQIPTRSHFNTFFSVTSRFLLYYCKGYHETKMITRKQRQLYVLPDEPRQLTTGGTIFSEIDKLNDCNYYVNKMNTCPWKWTIGRAKWTITQGRDRGKLNDWSSIFASFWPSEKRFQSKNVQKSRGSIVFHGFLH